MRLALIALLPLAGAAPALAAEPTVGQLYECRSTDGQVTLTLVVGKVDRERGAVIVGVSAWNDAAGTPAPEVGHLPFDAAALDLGCKARVGTRPLSADFAEGYAMWREAFDISKGGIFTASPADIYQHLLKSIPAPAKPEGTDS